MNSMERQAQQWAGMLNARLMPIKDRVEYDAMTTYDRPAHPMRSAALYRPDRDAVMGLSKNARVDVIPEPHGPNWHGDAALISYESAGDMGCLRFTVEMPDGSRLTVAEDRIRPAR